jgi:hypothetical protein
VAGATLAGGGDPAALVALVLIAPACAFVALVLASRLPAPQGRRRADRRTRRLPGRPSHALGAAALRETLRASDVRGGIGSGLLLAVVGPIAVSTIVEVPPFVVLALSGTTAAVAVSAIPAAMTVAGARACWMGASGGSATTRVLALATSVALGALPLLTVSLVLGATFPEIAFGARLFAVGAIAALVAARIMNAAVEPRGAFTAIYALAHALLAFAASTLGVLGSVTFCLALTAACLFVPDRKAELQ